MSKFLNSLASADEKGKQVIHDKYEEFVVYEYENLANKQFFIDVELKGHPLSEVIGYVIEESKLEFVTDNVRVSQIIKICEGKYTIFGTFEN